MTGLGLNVIAAEEFFNVVHLIRSCIELPDQHPAQFLDYYFSGHELVFTKDDLQQIGAQAARAERASEHVGVEEDPQDTLSKTSSSVRKPRAAAYGITLRRSC